jgi:3-hydroxybutyryl-CoA dehydratase
MNVRLETAIVGATVARAVYGPLGRDDLQRYAQASGDFNPLHLDPAFARQAGFDDVIVQGMLGMAFLGRLITESFPTYRPERFLSRFCSFAPLGQTVSCSARLERRDGDTVLLALTACIGTAGTIVLEGSTTLGIQADA